MTLEGGARYHDRIRKTADGSGTFDRIVNAIGHLVEAGINVNVRIQVSPESVATLDECFDRLNHLGLLYHQRTSLYFFPILNINKICSAKAYQCSQRYYNQEIFDKLWDYSRRYPVKAAPLPAPAWQVPYCSFVNQGAWIIDPDGRKYKCVSMLGKQEGQCGDIATSKNQELKALYRQREQQFIHRSGIAISECRSCTYLPICDGGCAYLAKEFTGSMDSYYCDMHKSAVQDHIKQLFKQRESKSQRTHATI